MNYEEIRGLQEAYKQVYAPQEVEEVYKGKHGQSDKEYADSRSQGGKMVSGDSKQSGAEYTHGRRVKAANPGMQPDVGGKTKPKSQGKMDRGTRADIEYRKANLKKEELELDQIVESLVERGHTEQEAYALVAQFTLDEDSRRISNKQHTARVRQNIKAFGSNFTPPNNYDPDANRGKGEVLTRKQIEKKRRKALRPEEVEYVEELYKGKHGQTDKQYADSRSQGGKMVSGDSKMSGAEYTHGRRVKAANPGMQPDVGGKTKPKSQGKMDKGTRADLEYRKANLKKEDLDIFDTVLEYLQVEGIAKSFEDAQWMMVNVLDEEDVDSILDEAITSEKGKAKAAEMISKRTTASGRAKPGQGANVAKIRHIGRANVDGYEGTPPNLKVAKNPVRSNFTGLKTGSGNAAARRAAALKKEEFEFWVDALVEEGYDLSDYTWDEMYEFYLDTGRHKK